VQGGNTMSAYWNAEHEEIKYQIGEGSSIDQLLGQWHASLYGLGDLFDPVQVKRANAAIFEYNYIPRMGDVYNPCRIYCLNDEGGLVICAWPQNERIRAQKPLIPAPYSQETMNGFEYSAAIHMIVTALRQRYDGERRNPWNEFECGSNYARSMASYALLNAFSGFEFDLVQHSIGFTPVPSQVAENNGHFRCFWSLDSGWGEFMLTPTSVEIRVLYGHLNVQTAKFSFLAGRTVRMVQRGEQVLPCSVDRGIITFASPQQIGTGVALIVAL
jgi:non-lysosomal glucosylceramidase